MTTGCVGATLEPERNFQELSEEGTEELHHQDHLKKPRRKDTPVLHSPPHIPGVRQMKAEKKTVYLEDQEQAVGD